MQNPSLRISSGLGPPPAACEPGVAGGTRLLLRSDFGGLVERHAHPEDARSVRIYLTKRGKELQPQLGEIIALETEHALRGFSAQERTSFVEMLERIAENAKDED